jgi:hypothetical protein
MTYGGSDSSASAAFCVLASTHGREAVADIIDTVNTNTTTTEAAVTHATYGLSALDTELGAMSGATFNTSTDSLEALRNQGDAAWTTATVTAYGLAIDGANYVVWDGTNITLYAMGE